MEEKVSKIVSKMNKYELAHEERNREVMERVCAYKIRNVNITDQEIEGLIDEWRDDSAMHSFPWTIMRGPAFEELMSIPKERLIISILRRLRDDSPAMAYQGVMQQLSGEDLGKWEEVAKGWRGYDVKSSAKIWVKWGKAQGYLDSDECKWGDFEDNLCYKCRKHKMTSNYDEINHKFPEDDGYPDKQGSTRVIEDICQSCGVVRRTIQGKNKDGEWENNVIRLWRIFFR